MKKKFYLSLFSLLLMGSILTAQNFQMKKWLLNNQTVDLSVEPPVVVQGLPGALNSQDNLGGGIYSSNGDLLFHVSPDASSNSRLNVVNKYGTNMGTIEGLTSAFGGELCIVPVPQTNCKFHLIYLSEALFLPTCPVGQVNGHILSTVQWI